MSGVLIKTGIYGLARVCFDFLGAAAAVVGRDRADRSARFPRVLGVLYALMEHDLKRLLAYHSIENIGIILMGLGAALLFLPLRPSRCWRRWRLIAGLYHTLNHASSRGCCSWARVRWCTPPTRATWRKWAAWPNACRRRRCSSSSARWPSPACRRSTASSANGSPTRRCCGLRHHRQPHPADVSHCRRAAGPHRRPGRGVFRESLRHHLPGAPRSEAPRTRTRSSPSMRAGMGILTLACVLLGLFPTLFVRSARSDHPATHRPGKSARAQPRQRPGAVSPRRESAAPSRPLGMALMACACCRSRWRLWLVLWRGRRRRGAARPGTAASAG